MADLFDMVLAGKLLGSGSGDGYAPTPVLSTNNGLKGYQSLSQPYFYIKDGYTIESCFMITDTSVAARQYQRLAEIVLNNGVLNILAFSNDAFEIDINDTWQSAASMGFTIPRDVIHTAALVVDSDIAYLYLDGELKKSVGHADLPANHITDLYSNMGEISNRDFLGTSYATRFYLRPLTADEVSNNHRLDKARFAAT